MEYKEKREAQAAIDTMNGGSVQEKKVGCGLDRRGVIKGVLEPCVRSLMEEEVGCGLDCVGEVGGVLSGELRWRRRWGLDRTV